MAQSGLKFIVVQADTKNSFDNVAASVAKASGRDVRVTQDYVIRMALAALVEKMELQRAQAVEVENVPK